MKKTGRLALSGIIAGMGVCIMLLSAVMPGFTYALPMIAGGLLLVSMIEFGVRTALTTFAATALLSFIMPCDKEAALMYTLLFGIYPIIKWFIERIKSSVLEFAVKLIYFNGAAAAAVLLAFHLFDIPIDDGTLGKWTIPLLLVVGNICFVIYDLTLSRCIPLYTKRLQPILHKTFHI